MNGAQFHLVRVGEGGGGLERNRFEIGLVYEEFERRGSGSFGNEFSKSAPASREERVSESAGGVAGIGFMTSWVGETGGRLAQNIAKSEFFRST